MTAATLIAALEDWGYRSYQPSSQGRTCVWAGSRRLPAGAPECEANGERIAWHVSLHRVDRHESAQVEIVGERHGQWWSLRSYAIQLGELLAVLPSVEQDLLGAWSRLRGAA